jgi:hypothetical protein
MMKKLYINQLIDTYTWDTYEWTHPYKRIGKDKIEVINFFPGENYQLRLGEIYFIQGVTCSFEFR